VSCSTKLPIRFTELPEGAINASAVEINSVDVELCNVGRGFESAGDLSSSDSCMYYGRALKAFEEEFPFIQGDSYIAYGKTISLEPVRQENQKALGRVKAKFEKAGCK
jgi:hypothetical protein